MNSYFSSNFYLYDKSIFYFLIFLKISQTISNSYQIHSVYRHTHLPNCPPECHPPWAQSWPLTSPASTASRTRAAADQTRPTVLVSRRVLPSVVWAWLCGRCFEAWRIVRMDGSESWRRTDFLNRMICRVRNINAGLRGEHLIGPIMRYANYHRIS